MTHASCDRVAELFAVWIGGLVLANELPDADFDLLRKAFEAGYKAREVFGG